jgi:hypothetical protein
MAAALVITCLPIASEADDADDTTKTYGAVKEFSWTELEKVSKELIGKSIEDILMMLLQNEYGYDIILSEPYFEGKMATERVTETVGDIYNIDDHISAYIEFNTTIKIQGKLPEAGTYERQDGEDVSAFLERVLKDNASKEEREVTLAMVLCVYADVDIKTAVNLTSGELISNNLVAKLVVAEYEQSNLTLETKEVDDELQSMTIIYEDQESFSNIYTNVDMNLAYEGMKIFTDVDSWNLSPKITSHVNHVFVSSDMASGVWDLVKQVIGIDEKVKSKLPELILNIIESGSRVVDLVQTIKSLTGTTIKDIDFLATINASKATDDDGRKYVNLKVLRPDDSKSLRFPVQDYNMTVSDVLELVPSSIVDENVKTVIAIATTLIGWGNVEVKELDQETQKKIDDIYDHTNTMIKYDEEYELNIPIEYLIMAIVGLIGCAVAAILIRRRSS